MRKGVLHNAFWSDQIVRMARFGPESSGPCFLGARPTWTRLAKGLPARSPLVCEGVRAEGEPLPLTYARSLPTCCLKVSSKRASAFHFFLEPSCALWSKLPEAITVKSGRLTSAG
jgi:hypothetical protein